MPRAGKSQVEIHLVHLARLLRLVGTRQPVLEADSLHHLGAVDMGRSVNRCSIEIRPYEYPLLGTCVRQKRSLI